MSSTLPLPAASRGDRSSYASGGNRSSYASGHSPWYPTGDERPSSPTWPPVAGGGHAGGDRAVAARHVPSAGRDHPVAYQSSQPSNPPSGRPQRAAGVPAGHPAHPAGRGGRARPASAIACGALLILAAAAGVWALVRTLVWTAWGQRVEDVIMGAIVTDWRTDRVLLAGLEVVSIGAVAVTLLALGAIALARRRPDLAIASAVLVAGANVTTQALKYGLVDRPDFGYSTLNTLPSGHVTVVTSVMVGLLLVLPASWRPVLVPVATLLGTTAGVATLVVAWHRPSDIIAAYLVVMAWAGAVVIGLAAAGRAGPLGPRQAAGRAIIYGLGASVATAVLGLALLIGGLTHAGGQQHLVAGAVGLGAVALGCAVGVCASSVAIDLLGEDRRR